MSDDGFVPRLNHVAASVDPAVLDETGRAEILAFYGEVFGWTEGDNTGEEGNPLILLTGAFGQFVYLLPGDPFMTAPKRSEAELRRAEPSRAGAGATHVIDHFGLQVATLDELHAIIERAKAAQRRDERVRVVDVATRTTHGAERDYRLTNAYVGFLLPLMVELQHLEVVPA